MHMIHRAQFLIFLVAGLCISFASRAEISPLSFAPEIIYEKDQLKVYDDFPKEIEKVLTHRALDVMVGNESLQPVSALNSMSKIFISKSYGIAEDKRMIYAMAKMNIQGPVEYGKIYLHPKGYVVHLKTKTSGDIALFFQGFNLTTVDEIKSKIVSSQPKIAQEKLNHFLKISGSFLAGMKSVFNLLAIQKSFAAGADQSVPALCGGAVSNTSSGSSATVLKNIWECTKGLGGGIWDATGGAVWFVAKGAYKVAFHPVETFNRAADGFSKMKAMMSDLEGSFGELKSTYDQLPDTVKWKLGCEIVSSIGTTAVIAYLTLGGGSPLLLRAISQSLLKIAATLPKGSSVATNALGLASKVGLKADKMSEVQILISGGVEGQQFVSTTKKLKTALDKVWDSQTSLNTANYNAAVNVKNAGLGLKYSNTTNAELFARDAVSIAEQTKRLAKAKQELSALQKQHSELSAAMSRVIGDKGTYVLGDKGVKEKILQELAAQRKLTPGQAAAASSYLAIQGCHLSSNISDTVANPATDSSSDGTR